MENLILETLNNGMGTLTANILIVISIIRQETFRLKLRDHEERILKLERQGGVTVGNK